MARFYGEDGALVFLHGFSVWKGKLCFFSVGIGALEFLHGFSVREGQTVSCLPRPSAFWFPQLQIFTNPWGTAETLASETRPGARDFQEEREDRLQFHTEKKALAWALKHFPKAGRGGGCLGL